MKHILLLFICSFFSLSLTAETKREIAVVLKWTGIQNWNVDSKNIDVISFENARYRTEDQLPYYYYETAALENYNYEVEIKNPQYIKVNTAETKILKQSSFSEKPEINSRKSKTDNKILLEVEVLPFIKKGTELLKLNSFNLVIKGKKQTDTSNNSETKHSFTSSSVLSQGKFVKVKITESGIYKLSYEDLKKKNLKPENLRIFGYGGAVLEEDFSKPIIDDLPEIAVHDTGDAILFYTQGVTKWLYDEKTKMFVHKNNPYSKFGYYFVTDENIGEKKRITQQEEINAENVTEIHKFTDYQLYEKDLISIINSGRELYGEKFQTSNLSKSFTFEFPNIIKESAVLVNLDVAANNWSEFSLNFNSSELTIDFGKFQGGYYEFAKAIKKNFSFPSSNSDQLNLQLKFKPKNGNTATGFLNFIELNVTRDLIMNGSLMVFHNLENIGKNALNRYHLKTSGNNSKIQIWDITNPMFISEMRTKRSEEELSFVDSTEQRKSYIAINLENTNTLPKAELLDEVPRQNIHGMEPIDMLIITHPRFRQQAERLALAHKNNNDLRVGVATTDEIYNEFSSGTPDATAYRKAAKLFFEKNNANDKLKYLLLFGKGAFDNGLLPKGLHEPLILTYQSQNSVHGIQSYVSDDYFTLLADGKGKNLSAEKMDVAIGRFPVTTEEEANIVVQKTIDYMNNSETGGWKNTVCFMGDDGDEAQHMKQANTQANIIAKEHPEILVKKILLDAYAKEKTASGESYTSVKNLFQRLWNSGMLTFSYMGHAYDTGMAKENILTLKDIDMMTNKALPLFIAGACNVSPFDNKRNSIGEQLLLTKRGGAIATFSSARTVFSSPNANLIERIFKNIFKDENQQQYSIADIIRRAKNEQGKEINKLSFIYIGDPSLKLNRPKEYKVATTRINTKSLTNEIDTLRALSTATIEGEVLNERGELAHNFNGYLHTTVFDKKETITSLNNDKGKNGAITFEDYPNTIFTGRAKVEGGKFKYSFLVPKNIQYNYGKGRIVHVVWDDKNNSGHGHCENFVLGGSTKNPKEDKDGPEATVYLNHPSFVNRGNVNESPLFVAKIFDESGINISGTGIGQDATLIINSQNGEKYILNDYFVSDLNSYKSGTISFKIPPLPDGEHTLTFKVWDLQNNSTTKEIKFNVNTGLSPEFIAVKSYPNPANEFCDFELEYKSEDFINEKVNVDIFNVSGSLIHSFSDVLIDRRIRWDLTNGTQKMPPGLYIYRIYLKKEDKILRSKANKLIVKY